MTACRADLHFHLGLDFCLSYEKKHNSYLLLMYYYSQKAQHKNCLGKVSPSEFWERGEFRMMVRKHKRILKPKCGGISTLNHGRYVRKAPFSLYSPTIKM